MAHISWSQQRLFQQALNGYGKAKVELSKQNSGKNLIQGLDLKKLAKVSSSSSKGQNAAKKWPLKKGQLNGEWESPHDFMCSSCAIVYDELREVLHHKWEAHPYCLVAHVTLRTDLNLPPSNMMHPQTGRSMTR